MPSFKLTATADPTPVVSALQGLSDFSLAFNPTWVQPTAATGNRSGLLVRVQNCSANVGTCRGECAGPGQNASRLAWLELSGDSAGGSPRAVGRLSNASVVFGPFDSTDSWGTEDPRLTYDPETERYYLLYNAWNGTRSSLSIASTRDPTHADGWTRHGEAIPSRHKSYKSGAIVLRPAPAPHLLIWGADSDLWLAPSIGRSLVSWNGTASTRLLGPRPQGACSGQPCWDKYWVEPAMPPLVLSTGDLLTFYNSFGPHWNSSKGPHSGFQPGWVVLKGDDPSKVLARATEPPLPDDQFAWEVGSAPWSCNTANCCNLGGGHALGDDTFRLYFGGADSVVGTATVKVEVAADVTTCLPCCSEPPPGAPCCCPPPGCPRPPSCPPAPLDSSMDAATTPLNIEGMPAGRALREMRKSKLGSFKRKEKLGGGAAGTWPSKECDAYISRAGPLGSANVLSWAASNQTLLNYLYGTGGGTDVRSSWQALTDGCRVVPLGCWCFHVAGSMVKAANPRGHTRCAPKDQLMDCSDPRTAGVFAVKARRNCSCFAQSAAPAAPPCLFGDMRPAKLLAIISACRAAGVTHIIEQGRYGGLSAYIYALHGFKVTSVELLPLSEVGTALKALAPSVTQVDADGRKAVVELVKSSPPGERVAVIFDGEKRQTAYETFQLVRSRVALAAFDDTNLDDGAFPRMLQQRGEAAWHTWDCAFMARHADAAPLQKLEGVLRTAAAPLVARLGEERLRRQGQLDHTGRLIFHGGMEDLARFHTTIVRGEGPSAL